MPEYLQADMAMLTFNQARIHCCGHDSHAHNPNIFVTCHIFMANVYPTALPTPIYFIDISFVQEITNYIDYE